MTMIEPTEVRVQTGREGITINRVADLYALHDVLDVPSYYKKGEVNPYAALTSMIPREAAFYTMVLDTDPERVRMARLMMKGMAINGMERTGLRRRVREALREKHEVNYGAFAKAGRVVVMWV